GATVQASDVRVVTRPVSTVAGDALHRASEVVGRVVRSDILRDDPIRAAHLAADERTGLDGIVPVGRRAVYVTTKDGLTPPEGAVVDVLAAFDPTAASMPRGRAIVVATGARVIAANAVDPGGSGQFGSDATAGVTLLVTEAEARAIAFAAANGALSLALDPPEAACCTSSSP
ncbi:MAG TPA: RcpC/CpaB family pilus assembly protein, partial [Acidimicrobiia bacterium]|nr:RcpC/CpaB family pilus assembly protein [Acidimicrobiia bacterium]